jgi:hypothetical protein
MADHWATCSAAGERALGAVEADTTPAVADMRIDRYHRPGRSPSEKRV